jgi:hypothetical protein
MGGYRGGRDTTSSYHALDARWLYRKRILDRGYPSSVTWSRDGEVVSSIQVRGESGRVMLEYTNQRYGEEREHLSYPVSLEWTRCNYGGMRPWFICPVRVCGRRVAVLYGGKIFACRHCHQLAYDSQHEARHGRALSRAQKIREKLGGSGSTAEEFPSKPKGMHWRTYDALCRKAEGALNQSWPPWLIREMLRRP